jgi:hypothetical protein
LFVVQGRVVVGVWWVGERMTIATWFVEDGQSCPSSICIKRRRTELRRVRSLRHVA